MKIKNVLTSQAIRFWSNVEPIADKRSPIPLIKSLQERYGFVEVPSTIAALDFTKGVSFLQGYYKGSIIEKLQVYENGLLCEASADNAVCDEFMGEIIDWAKSEHAIPIAETGVKAFVSQMELIVDVDFVTTFARVNAIGALIASMLQNYGQPVPNYGLSGLKLHYDSMTLPVPRAPEFSFERRASELYSTNTFFSSAPLRSQDHFFVLSELEKVLK
jgi:hypothetical protein